MDGWGFVFLRKNRKKVMKYFVYISDCENCEDDITILRDSTLENAIAFASYVFVNSHQDIQVRTENDLVVVDYKSV